jgi:hypothetical protein
MDAFSIVIKVLGTFAPRYRLPVGSGRPREEYVEVYRELLPKGWEFVIPEKTDQDLFARLASDVDVIFGMDI